MGRHNPAKPQLVAGRTGVRIRAFLSLGTVLGLGTVGTLAAWSDTATATAEFTAGTLDIELVPGAADDFPLESLGMTNMYPGSSKAGMVEVSNAGSLPFAYNITAVDSTSGTASALLSALTVAVYEADDTEQVATDGNTCQGALVASSSTAFNAESLLNVKRQLESAASEQLCIQVTLPAGAENALQGTTANAIFSFTAEQVS